MIALCHGVLVTELLQPRHFIAGAEEDILTSECMGQFSIIGTGYDEARGCAIRDLAISSLSGRSMILSNFMQVQMSRKIPQPLMSSPYATRVLAVTLSYLQADGTALTLLSAKDGCETR
jgi:hypothetical protein